MIPSIQSIFDSTAPIYGPWVYVGKYTIWSLYGLNVNDGTISVEAVSIPTNIFIEGSLTNPTALQSLGIQSDNIYNPPYQPTAGPWKPFTTYPTNSLILDYNNNVQKATTGGVSGSSVPTFSTSGTTQDNTVTWTYLQFQGNSNYNAAPQSSQSPIGVVICPSMSISAQFTTTGYGTVLYNAGGSPAQSSGLYIPSDDIYVSYIRVNKVGGGTAETVVYLAGQVDG
jgi:hypothetical protein